MSSSLEQLSADGSPKPLDRVSPWARLDPPTMTTERSRRLPPAASGVPVTDAMARPVVTVDPEMGLLDLMRLFVTAGIGGAPVVDASGSAIGVVSKTDLLRELYDQAGSASTGPASRARDIMTGNPVVVTEDTPLSQAAGRMAQEHLHRVFVVDHTGAITGVLSSSDIVDWLARED